MARQDEHAEEGGKVEDGTGERWSGLKSKIRGVWTGAREKVTLDDGETEEEVTGSDPGGRSGQDDRDQRVQRTDNSPSRVDGVATKKRDHDWASPLQRKNERVRRERKVGDS